MELPQISLDVSVVITNLADSILRQSFRSSDITSSLSILPTLQIVSPNLFNIFDCIYHVTLV